MTRRLVLGIVAATAVAVTLVLAVVVGGAYRTLHRPYAGWDGEFVDVVIPQGLDAGSMLELLGDAGVVRHPRIVKIWLWWRGGSESLQAGEYRFARPTSPAELMRRLERGDVLLHSVTVPEGLNLTQTADLLEQFGFGPRAELLERFSDPTPVRDLDPVATDLEGYLFPDTYRFARDATAEKIVSVMVAGFFAAIGDDYIDRAAAAGLEFRAAVTLASMIEKETSVPEERATISRVFHNRLARGMKMQCDPTVLYALGRAGREVDRLSLADLEFDSPWNTYRNYGLPPGPIASPGKASLEAAVRPAEGTVLYFVAAPGGGHRFSGTLEAHRRAVAEWRAYLRSSR